MIDAGLDAVLTKRGWVQALICGAIGGVAALGQAPFDLWPLTIFALGLLLACLRRTRSAKHAFVLGWAAGGG